MPDLVDTHGTRGTRVQLELNEEETTALRRLFEEALRELSGEIADTDNAVYRQGLNSYRDTLRTIQSKL
jgi:hypothetical protein